MRSVQLADEMGVGATPVAWGEFTSPGGGSRPRRDRPTKSTKRLFARLSLKRVLSVSHHQFNHHEDQKYQDNNAKNVVKHLQKLHLAFELGIVQLFIAF